MSPELAAYVKEAISSSSKTKPLPRPSHRTAAPTPNAHFLDIVRQVKRRRMNEEGTRLPQFETTEDFKSLVIRVPVYDIVVAALEEAGVI